MVSGLTCCGVRILRGSKIRGMDPRHLVDPSGASMILHHRLTSFHARSPRAFRRLPCDYPLLGFPFSFNAHPHRSTHIGRRKIESSLIARRRWKTTMPPKRAFSLRTTFSRAFRRASYDLPLLGFPLSFNAPFYVGISRGEIESSLIGRWRSKTTMPPNRAFLLRAMSTTSNA